jgi:GNAT superfamily N-acetyltransferase
MAQGSHEADPLVIRPAVASDAELITNLIRELAVYEKLEHAVKATPSSLRAMLFERTPPAAESLVAEWEGQAAGFALFFATFSTFRAQTGLYLEDLFVRPEFRGRGIGKALLSELARLGVERGCGRIEWAVLDWNQPAIEFYQAHGARPLSDWITYRVDGEALVRLATVRTIPGDEARS